MEIARSFGRIVEIALSDKTLYPRSVPTPTALKFWCQQDWTSGFYQEAFGICMIIRIQWKKFGYSAASRPLDGNQFNSIPLTHDLRFLVCIALMGNGLDSSKNDIPTLLYFKELATFDKRFDSTIGVLDPGTSRPWGIPWSLTEYYWIWMLLLGHQNIVEILPSMISL